MIVVDANIVVYFVLSGPNTAMARRVFAKHSVWCVPELWKHEYLNVLVTLAKTGHATREQCLQAWEHAGALLTGRVLPVDPLVVFRIAVDHRISAYDAQYVALAEELNVQCVSEDGRLRRTFPGRVATMQEFVQCVS
jgi:predicted nucleic acid-binding protein